MIKKAIFAALFAGSLMVGIPQTASANGCGLNCVYVIVLDGHGNITGGYWDCPEQMECVEP